MTPLNEKKMSDARKALAVARTPMGRFGQISELVGAAVYLASTRRASLLGDYCGRRWIPCKRALMRADDRCSDGFGVEADGVDLASPLTDAAFKEIERKFFAGQVMVLHGQRLTPRSSTHSRGASAHPSRT